MSEPGADKSHASNKPHPADHHIAILDKTADTSTGPTASPFRWLLVIIPILTIFWVAPLLLSDLLQQAATFSEQRQTRTMAGPQTEPETRFDTPEWPTPPIDAEPSKPPPTTTTPPERQATPSAPPPSAGQPGGAPPPQREATFDPQAVVALISSADPAEGAQRFRVCTACHTATPDGEHMVGPNLWGIVNRPFGAADNYAYSTALKTRSDTWTYANLAAYLYNPRAFAPGTKMAFAGIKNPQRLADMIAYLRLLSEKRVPPP